MLILDASRVDRISLKRFASAVENELMVGSQTGEHNLAWQCLSTTLSHNLRSTIEDDENSTVLNKLRTQVESVKRLKPITPSQVDKEDVESTNVTFLPPIESKPTVKLSATTGTVADSTSDSSAVDTASGERIQHLLQDQKDLSAKDLEVEQRTQAMLVNELTELTSMLKESTLDINRAVKLQNVQLASMGVHAAENRDELEKQKQRMKESTQGMSSSLWATVWLMVWIIGLFCATYAVIRLLPSRTVYPTCSSEEVHRGSAYGGGGVTGSVSGNTHVYTPLVDAPIDATASARSDNSNAQASASDYAAPTTDASTEYINVGSEGEYVSVEGSGEGGGGVSVPDEQYTPIDAATTSTANTDIVSSTGTDNTYTDSTADAVTEVTPLYTTERDSLATGDDTATHIEEHLTTDTHTEYDTIDTINSHINTHEYSDSDADTSTHNEEYVSDTANSMEAAVSDDGTTHTDDTAYSEDQDPEPTSAAEYDPRGAVDEAVSNGLGGEIHTAAALEEAGGSTDTAQHAHHAHTDNQADTQFVEVDTDIDHEHYTREWPSDTHTDHPEDLPAVHQQTPEQQGTSLDGEQEYYEEEQGQRGHDGEL